MAADHNLLVTVAVPAVPLLAVGAVDALFSQPVLAVLFAVLLGFFLVRMLPLAQWLISAG